MRLALLVGLLLFAVACSRSARRDPSDDVRAEIDKAEAAEKKRQHDVARGHYRAALAKAKDPASTAYARYEYGQTLITWGEFPEAIAQLEGVVAVRSDDAATWHDLGMLYHNAGDDQRAIAALERARTLAPDDTRPRVTLAVLLWKRGDRTRAAAEYRALLELELPDKLREKVTWALAELAKPAGTGMQPGDPEAPP